MGGGERALAAEHEGADDETRRRAIRHALAGVARRNVDVPVGVIAADEGRAIHRPPSRTSGARRLPAAGCAGTLEKDKPPILGLIQRGGQVVLHMLANVQQTTIQPIIAATVAKSALIHTDEYGIYARL